MDIYIHTHIYTHLKRHRDQEIKREREREILYSVDSESSKGYFRTLANKLLQDGKKYGYGCVCVCVCVCVSR